MRLRWVWFLCFWTLLVPWAWTHGRSVRTAHDSCACRCVGINRHNLRNENYGDQLRGFRPEHSPNLSAEFVLVVLTEPFVCSSQLTRWSKSQAHECKHIKFPPGSDCFMGQDNGRFRLFTFRGPRSLVKSRRLSGASSPCFQLFSSNAKISTRFELVNF